MDDKEQNFVVALTGACNSHEDWLTIIRFGMPTLLDNQPFLMELIVREAGRMAEGELSHSPADEARTIFDELGLRFVGAAWNVSVEAVGCRPKEDGRGRNTAGTPRTGEG